MSAGKRIEVLSFDGCPNDGLALRRAHQAVITSGIDAEVVAIRVASAEEAVARRFLGSPSVRVDGIDVDAAAALDTEYGLRCRVYAHDGRMDGAPPTEWIAAALRGEVVTRTTIVSEGCCANRETASETTHGLVSPASSLDLTALADSLSAAFPPGSEKLVVTLIRLLADGTPVSRCRLAAALDWPVDRLANALARIPSIEYENDEIVGAALSLRETPHVFEIGTRRLYTWCALDALFIPRLLGETCRVTSPCPATGALVRLEVAADAVLDISPPGAAVSVIMGGCEPDLRRSFCDRVRFFASGAAAVDWIGEPAGKAIISVEDAFLLGAAIAGRLGWRV